LNGGKSVAFQTFVEKLRNMAFAKFITSEKVEKVEIHFLPIDGTFYFAFKYGSFCISFLLFTND